MTKKKCVTKSIQTFLPKKRCSVTERKKLSTGFTLTPIDSSSGVSNVGYTMPSDLRLWADETSATPQVLAYWKGGHPTNAYQHAMAFPTTSFSGSADEHAALMWRILCHIIVDRLPQPALKDVAESLRDAAEFYATRQFFDVPRLTSSSVVGQVVSTQERLPFDLT